MRRIMLPALVVAVVAGMAAAPAAAQTTGCAQRFPDARFDLSLDAGPVAVLGSGLTEGILGRYADGVAEVAGWVVQDIGGLDGVEVCIFADRLPLDAEALGWPEGQALRAAVFPDEGLIVLSGWLIGVVEDAALVGVVHTAQWRSSGGAYPEPFGSEVIGYYRARVNGSAEATHNAFVRANTGLREPWDPIPWAGGTIPGMLLWNPEYGYGGAGDFAAFAAEATGGEVLGDPDVATLERLDEEWRLALFEESGAVPGGSKGWILGAIAATIIIGGGVFLAWAHRLSRRRVEEQLRRMVERGPLLEDEDDSPIKTSVGSGVGGRDARVGRPEQGTRRVGRDQGDRPPARRPGRRWRDGVADDAESGDDLFRHPGFDGDG
jgi:hypothetical protein